MSIKLKLQAMEAAWKLIKIPFTHLHQLPIPRLFSKTYRNLQAKPSSLQFGVRAKRAVGHPALLNSFNAVFVQWLVAEIVAMLIKDISLIVTTLKMFV